ncbi:MAG: RloB family protein [Caldisericia bacterium]|nr:RloB family protein [Caldisericia bacterium]
MVPLREFRPLTEEINPIPFRRKYFFLCEGRVTEVKYLKQLVQNRTIIGIKDDTELTPLIKEGEHKDISNPKKLLDLAIEWRRKKKAIGIEEFDPNLDRIILVFDLDSFRMDPKKYINLVNKIKEEKILSAVTNPSFELWLMLHKENSLQDYILPNHSKLLLNSKVSAKHTEASKMCSDLLHFNSKRNVYFKDFRKSLMVAIQQELSVEQDIYNMIGRLGSNIGSIIQSILDANTPKN